MAQPVNPLAYEIRRIPDHYDAGQIEGDRYVADLVDRIERLADVPDLGLTADQEIRARALAIAVDAIDCVPGWRDYQLLETAGQLAEWIRSGWPRIDDGGQSESELVDQMRTRMDGLRASLAKVTAERDDALAALQQARDADGAALDQLGIIARMLPDDLARTGAAVPTKVHRHIEQLTDRLTAAEAMAAELVQCIADGNASDGYHTHAELYEYRMLYNAHAAAGWVAAGIPVFKSWRHHDGEECFGGGWFVVMAKLPTGQVSNHYRAEHWGLFEVPALDRAPLWDGHTPAEAANRLRAALEALPEREADRG